LENTHSELIIIVGAPISQASITNYDVSEDTF